MSRFVVIPLSVWMACASTQPEPIGDRYVPVALEFVTAEWLGDDLVLRGQAGAVDGGDLSGVNLDRNGSLVIGTVNTDGSFELTIPASPSELVRLHATHPRLGRRFGMDVRVAANLHIVDISVGLCQHLVTESAVDFGMLAQSADEQNIEFTNHCSSDLEITSVAFLRDQGHVVAPEIAGLTLEPEESRPVNVRVMDVNGALDEYIVLEFAADVPDFVLSVLAEH